MYGGRLLSSTIRVCIRMYICVSLSKTKCEVIRLTARIDKEDFMQGIRQKIGQPLCQQRGIGMEVSSIGIEGLDLLLYFLDDVRVLVAHVTYVVTGIEVCVAEVVDETAFGSGDDHERGGVGVGSVFRQF
jgi:hypothetical protein